MARVPLTRNSTGQFARVAQLVAGSNVTISESLTGQLLTVTVAASGGGGGTPASSVVSETTFGLSPVVGTSTDYARGDHSHGSPTIPLASSVVSETAFGQSSAVGTSTSVARQDHTHGTPTIPLASSVVSETAFGQSSAIGTSTNVARQDHTHGTPAVPAHSALSTLGWTSSGHTGSTTSVAAFNGGGAAQVVQATADETMLVRRGGTLQWVAIVAAIGFLNDPETDEDFIYDSISTQSAEVAPGVIS
jgi:hypothetical protein